MCNIFFTPRKSKFVRGARRAANISAALNYTQQKALPSELYRTHPAAATALGSCRAGPAAGRDPTLSHYFSRSFFSPRHYGVYLINGDLMEKSVEKRNRCRCRRTFYLHITIDGAADDIRSSLFLWRRTRQPFLDNSSRQLTNDMTHDTERGTRGIRGEE